MLNKSLQVTWHVLIQKQHMTEQGTDTELHGKQILNSKAFKIHVSKPDTNAVFFPREHLFKNLTA